MAGTNDAIEALARGDSAGAAEVVPAQSVQEALDVLERGPVETIACNVRFDESRMFEFLQAVMDRKLRRAHRRVPGMRIRRLPKDPPRDPQRARGARRQRFIDLSQLRAEYGDDVARETLRKIVLEDTFVPPAPSGQCRGGSIAKISGKPMDELLYEVRDGVGYVTFNRPQARNALTFAHVRAARARSASEREACGPS